MTTTAATLAFHSDGTVTFEGRTRQLSEVSSIAVMGTNGDDTLTVDRGMANPAIAISFDGGPGFDTLATAGTVISSRSVAVNGSTGTLYLDATTVTYTNIEPISNSGTAADMVFTLSGGDDQATLTQSGTTLTLASSNGTFELTTFTAPTSSLTIDGGAGWDAIVLSGPLTLGTAALTIHAEKITLASGTVLAVGTVLLDAADTVAGGPRNPLSDPRSCTTLATHCGNVEVTLQDSEVSSAGFTAQAFSGVVPDASDTLGYAVNVSSKALVSLLGTTRLAATGDVVLSASSTVGPVTLLKDYGDAAIVSSDAEVTIGGSSVVTATGEATVSSTSTVDAAAAPGSAGKSEGSPDSSGSSAKDAAVAVITVSTTALSRVTNTAHLEIAGDLALTATNHAALSGTGDASAAGSGAGIAVVTMSQTTQSVINSTSITPTMAANITLTANADGAGTAAAKASPGGSTANDKPVNDSSRANGQANTTDGSIGLAGALAVSVLNAVTQAVVQAANLVTGALRLLTASQATASATADGSATSSGALGVGVGVGITVATVTTEAYIADGATIQATSVTVDSDEGGANGSGYASSATSGSTSSGSGVGVAGSFALTLVNGKTLAEIRGTGNALTGTPAVALKATGKHTNSATANAAQNGGATGAGASIALGIIDSLVAARVLEDAALTGAGALALAATGSDTTTTTATGGAKGGTNASLMGVVAITISNVHTIASLLAGPALTLAGSLTGTAVQTASATTTATGSTAAGAGASLAAAISFALTVARHRRGLLDRPRHQHRR